MTRPLIQRELSAAASAANSATSTLSPSKLDIDVLVGYLDDHWSLGERRNIAHSVMRYLAERVPADRATHETVPAAVTTDEIDQPPQVVPTAPPDTVRASAGDTMRGLSPPAPAFEARTTSDTIWSRLKGELRDFAEHEQDHWGEVDETELARYVAGQCSAAERWRIERTMRDHPAVAECVELVREVMTEQKPVTTISKTELTAKPPRRIVSTRLVAATLFIALGSLGLQVADQLGWTRHLGIKLGAANSTPQALRDHLVETASNSAEDDKPVANEAFDSATLRGLCIQLDQTGCLSPTSRVPLNKAVRLANGPLDPLDKIPLPSHDELWGLLQPTTSALQRAVASKAISQQITDPAKLTLTESDALAQGRSADAMAQFVLSRELPNEAPISLDDVLKSLQSDSRLERWAAVAALSQTWNPSCGATLVAVPNANDYVPSTTMRLQPESDQHFSGVNAAKPPRTATAVPTATHRRIAHRPATELLAQEVAPKSATISERHVPVELDLNEKDEEPIGSPFPRTFSQPTSSYEEPVEVAPKFSSPLQNTSTHPLAAQASQIVPSLIALLADSEDRMVRLTAIYVLAEFGPDAKPAIETLTAIVEKDPEPLARRWAAYALGRIGPEAFTSLPRLLKQLDKEPNGTVATALCYAVGELGHGLQDSTARGLFEVTLDRVMKQHSQPQVRRWAAYAIHSLNTAPAVQHQHILKPVIEPPSVNEGEASQPVPLDDAPQAQATPKPDVFPVAITAPKTASPLSRQSALPHRFTMPPQE